jgi:nucleoside phosphorylase
MVYSWMRPPSRSCLRIAPAGGVETGRAGGRGSGVEAERAGRPMAVVVLSELAQHAVQVTAVGDQQPVEALPSDGADESLSDRVCLVLQSSCG